MSRNDSGVALINVLVLLAITSGLVVLLLRQQERGQDIVAQAAALAQAEQIALGAEASVLSALRADLDTAPEADHFAEPWASVIQEAVTLPDGQFSVEVRDRQAKFDINTLAAGSLGPQVLFMRLATDLDISEDAAQRIVQVLGFTGPLRRLADLERSGITAETLDLLAPHVIALATPGLINLNTVDPVLMGALFQNPGITAQLLRRRRSEGEITRQALTDYGAVRPAMTGFISHSWEVDILAESGTAAVRLQTVIQRRDDLFGKAIAVVTRQIVHLPAPKDELEK
ncbi:MULTISPECIES: general secretion pathway protein GspK [unclassified Marinovum]